MDLDKSELIRKVLIKGRDEEIFKQFRFARPPSSESPLKF